MIAHAPWTVRFIIGEQDVSRTVANWADVRALVLKVLPALPAADRAWVRKDVESFCSCGMGFVKHSDTWSIIAQQELGHPDMFGKDPTLHKAIASS